MKKFLSMALISALIFSVSGFAGMAPAQEKKKPDRAAQFKRLDKNDDGKLTLEEFLGNRGADKKEAGERQFKRMDKNGDGALSLEEFTADTAKPAPKKKPDNN